MQANELDMPEEDCCPGKGTDIRLFLFSLRDTSAPQPSIVSLPLSPECWNLFLVLHLGVQEALSIDGFYLRVVVLGINLRPGQC